MVKILDANYSKVNIDECIPDHSLDNEKEALRNLHLFLTISTMEPSVPLRVRAEGRAQPYFARQFDIPEAYKEATKKEVAQHERLGVIVRDANSPWAAPAFIIPKKFKPP
ncbi:hypothetical protein PF010_g2438 [Phytophthora fragariae]|uniref:Uncharacterized protein n=1 Tax=Phytophthora fragariae TaxID=53985 RepID=A0A6G0P275_9STRA|nr:hypothetical protein PF010_g2438 [Phytophthora fragariae]KAE9232194.1 hypothetical protein PF004_g9988 [Phytophthora fragariae]